MIHQRPSLQHSGFIHRYIEGARKADALVEDFEAIYSEGFDLMHEVARILFLEDLVVDLVLLFFLSLM